MQHQGNKQTKAKYRINKETLEIRAEMHEIENIKIIEKINKTKSSLRKLTKLLKL